MALLVMGKPAKKYLDFIRPQLSEPLKREVDRVWNRIVKEDL